MATITIYTKPTCAYCDLVKKFLDMKGAAYTTIDMESSPEATQRVLTMTGKTMAPTTVVEKADGTTEVITGFNLGRLAPAIA